MSHANAVTTAADFADVVEALRIPYVISGSLASMVHGVRRSTNDVDVALALNAMQVERFAEALSDDFLVSRDAIAAAAQSRGSFNALHRTTYMRIDAYVRAIDEHFAEELRRAQRITLDRGAEQYARFVTAEDIVLEKLRWYELGGRTSERQWSDVLGVLKLQAARLELAYLRHWGARLGVSESLERALTAAGASDAPTA